MNAMEQHARAFAITAHADQRYGDKPYSYHLDAVASLAASYGEEAVVIAYLHDAAEDTQATIAEIEGKFGPKVAACVSLLTDEPGANRMERKAKTYAKLAGVQGPNEIALLVKTADRLANVRACVQDRKKSLWLLYQSEQSAFKSSAYRRGQCEPLWAELESLLSDGAFDAYLFTGYPQPIPARRPDGLSPLTVDKTQAALSAGRSLGLAHTSSWRNNYGRAKFLRKALERA
jgi:guanosine-3',5'-bis(diphosphate) 3'-pyrophosphohydrolase